MVDLSDEPAKIVPFPAVRRIHVRSILLCNRYDALGTPDAFTADRFQFDDSESKNKPPLLFGVHHARFAFRRLCSDLYCDCRLRSGRPHRRAGQALDNAGKNIRYRVESEIARGQIAPRNGKFSAASCAGSSGTSGLWAPRCNSRSSGRGGDPSRIGPQRCRQAACGRPGGNTIGVTSVVDELAVVKEVKVIKAESHCPGDRGDTPGHHRDEGHREALTIRRLFMTSGPPGVLRDGRRPYLAARKAINPRQAGVVMFSG